LTFCSILCPFPMTFVLVTGTGGGGDENESENQRRTCGANETFTAFFTSSYSRISIFGTNSQEEYSYSCNVYGYKYKDMDLRILCSSK